MFGQAVEMFIYIPNHHTLLPLVSSLKGEGQKLVLTGAQSTDTGELLASADLLRWQPGQEPAPSQGSTSGVVLGAEYTFLEESALKAAYARALATGLRVHAEILSEEHAVQAQQLGAHALVACSFEGPGLVSEETGLVLLRAVSRRCPELPVVLRGGVGPDSAAAAVAAGASGVVLEHQLWACDVWPVSDKIKKRISSFNPTDTRSLGHTLGMRYRVFAQIATRAPKELAALEEELITKSSPSPQTRREFLAILADRTTGNPLSADLKSELLPLGQCAALAAPLAQKYETPQAIIKAVRERIESSITHAAAHFPFMKNQGAAQTNHTDLPLHQGPMAQVSDTPAFAKAVVDHGSMPWLALGNMPTHVAEDIVWKTGEALQGKPFGAGIIGLDANRYRDEHIEMLGRAAKKFPSMMGLVAAGTAEQALQMEKLGVKSYLHTPTPGVLRAALANGQKLLLLEGTEAGGHIGQLGGMLLWQSCIIEIEQAIESMNLDPSSLTVLPAGGIGDAESSAAVAVMFDPLIRRGVKVGLQMGTSYLMTHEAVNTGAINSIYQKVGENSPRTVVLGESVGAPTRMLPNEAAAQVAQREIDRITNNVSLKERKEAYEHDNLGGLRAAAKAQRIDRIDPEKGAIFASLTAEEQERDGLFHCGQGINLWRAPKSMAALHEEVTTGARDFLTQRFTQLQHQDTMATQSTTSQSTPSNSAQHAHEEDKGLAIAIVGVGAKLPGALSVKEFWSNVEQGVSAIKPVPADRWNYREYYDEDRDAPDRTYSMIGGWVEGFEFDRKAFRLPPMVVKQMDPSQTLWLAAAREALEDAKLFDDMEWDRERCAVILGNAMGGDVRDFNDIRLLFPEVERGLRQALAAHNVPADQVDGLLATMEEKIKGQFPPITEDTMPGELANVIAGRTAQLFDLGGPNFIVDAACASSLAAIEQAVRGLRARRFDVALTGGVDRCMGPSPYIKFSKIGALSPDGSRPFDEDANGFVMGEGAAALILKRLEDAERDGDTVYAVIQGIGASSDGKGKAITAPNPIGQRRALVRAYEEAKFPLSSVSLVEAHGTSTPVGDPVEVGTLAEVLLEDKGELSADYIALGSVKSMIGHLKAAAGAASVLKVAMALHKKVLPPTINVKKLNPALNLEATPIRIQHTAAPWNVRQGASRRAGVSAFGFGGTNFHIAMEEYVPASQRTINVPQSQSNTSSESSSMTSTVTASTTPKSLASEGILGLHAASQSDLLALVGSLATAIESGDQSALLPWSLDVQNPGSLPVELSQLGEHRIAVVYEKIDEIAQLLGKAKKALERNKGWRILSNQGVFSSYEASARGKVAMLFPGQGSQYIGMLSGLAERYAVVRDTFKEADNIMRPALDLNLSDLIHPDLTKVDKGDAFFALSQTEITQPAVLTVDVALLRLLDAFGITPDVVAGHSLGEYGACVAAGVMTFDEALQTVALRGTQMANATPMNGDCGLMAAVPMGADEVEAELAVLQPGYVVCANKNSPSQTIIAGLTEPVKKAVAHFEEKGLQVMLLPVSHAFHSEVVAAASKPLREHMGSLDIKVPVTPILTNVTGGYYPTSSDEIRDLLAHQVAAPVEFMAMIEQMYNDGARVFVEVGPKRAQASFVSSILGDREHVSIYTNHPKKGDLRSWLDALAMLWITESWSAAKTTATQSTTTAAPAPQAAQSGVARTDVAQRLLNVLCEKTGYDADEIEFDYELEADLGIDTVKQAEIIAAVRDHYNMERDEDFRLADYPTLNALTDYVVGRLGSSAPSASAPAPQVAASVEAPAETVSATPAQQPSAGADRDEVAQRLLDVLCEKTGYDADEIEFDYELEADLGIDTVKQAEIIAAVRDHYNMERDEDFRLADYPTLNALTDYVVGRLGSSAPSTSAPAPQVAASVEAPAETVSATAGVARDEVAQMLLDVLCEKTGYDADEIEFDYELEADLGIDTVKQAEIIAAVRDHYNMERDEDFRLADYPTLNALTDYVVGRMGASVATPVSADASTLAAPVAAPVQTSASSVSRDEVAQMLLDVLCEKTGYDADEIEFDYELEADLGIDTVKQAEIIAAVRDHYNMERDEDFRLADYPTLNALTDYVVSRLGSSPTPPENKQAVPTQPAEKHLDLEAQIASRESQLPAPVMVQVSDAEREIVQHKVPAKIVISGSALGLPGQRELFADDALEALFNGENMILKLSEEQLQAQVDNRIVRLVKHEDGSGEMVEVVDKSEVVKLAGRTEGIDLAGRWGVPDRLVQALDETSRMAFAAGIDALRDAGLPLIPRYRTTRNGGKITIGWQLPDEIGEGTGVIFASAFAGKDEVIEQVKARYTDSDFKFDHRFLLKILGMANARFAEYIGARGPNMQINVACSSTTAAMTMAEDWIEMGRCERVIVLAADNAGGDTLNEWLVSGFLAAGAATTAAKVEDGALPFDRRRHGMIVGSGAVAFVFEKGGEPEKRGIEPLADLLGAHVVNSAFHPTRLDVHHIAGQVEKLVADVEQKFDLDRKDIAPHTLFVSHETFTPARGGSAAAEIESLRHVFKDRADDVVIANTKGFTGHPMAASIEDGLAVKALQHQLVPPIPNLKEPDPELGNLKLSQGGSYPIDYALRFSAGFGSQFGVSLFRFRARTEDRLFSSKRQQAWIERVSGMENPVLEVEKRTLRLRELSPEELAAKETNTGDAGKKPSGQAAYTLPQALDARVDGMASSLVQANVSAHQLETFAPRQVVTTALTLDQGSGQGLLKGKSVAICGGAPQVVKVIEQALGEFSVASVKTIDSELLLDESFLMGALAMTDAVIFAEGIQVKDTSRQALHEASKKPYHLGRAWQAALGEHPGKDHVWLSLIDMGGELGLTDKKGVNHVHGALCGATKSLAREWQDAQVCVVDFAQESTFDSSLVTTAIKVGLAGAKAGEVELGLSKSGDVVHAAASTIKVDPDKASALNSDSVVLLTGGAKGITASVALDLARRYKCTLVLAGRTKMTYANPLAEDVNAHKKQAKEALKARGERATPVAVKNAVRGLVSQQEIVTNMLSMKALGASDVEYVACDLANAQAVHQMIDDVAARHGKIDVVVHGAGLEISRLLEQKDETEFDRVFCGKALGFLDMYEAAQKNAALKGNVTWIAFSSIAGRFGNMGQIDYSSANDACGRLVSHAVAQGEQAMVIDWTAWADVGMASRGSMPEILGSKGVEFLPVEVGAMLPALLLEENISGEVLVAGKLGDMGGLKEVGSVTGWSDVSGQPLVDQVQKADDSSALVKRMLDVQSDRFMRDHVYEGVPLMPGVMGLELMIEAARQVVGEDVSLAQIKDVKFDRALKLHRSEPAEVLARATQTSADEVTVEVLSRRTTKTGREVEQKHYSCKVLVNKGNVSVSKEAMVLDPTQGTWLRGPEREEIYKRFFHEGTFQVLQSVVTLSEECIIGYGVLGEETLVQGVEDSLMETDPLAREAAFQVMGLWGMICDGLSYLPHGIERDLSLGKVVKGERFVIRGKRGESGKEGILRFDRIEVCDEQGALLHIYEGVDMVGHQKLREDSKFERCYETSWTSLRVDAEALSHWMGSKQVDDLINGSELHEHSRLISERRRQEWLAARLAAKELARNWARDFFGASWDLKDFVIEKDEFGAPSLATRAGLEGVGALPFITMSHSHGVAFAAISAPGEPAPIGVDIEHIESRDEAFARDYFTSEELALSPGEGVERDTLVTALWCCKESVSKALGLGLKLRVSDMIIESFEEDELPGLVVKINLRRDAQDAMIAQGSSGMQVRLFIEDEFVVAVAQGVKREGVSRKLEADELQKIAKILREKSTTLQTEGGAERTGVVWRH